MMLCDMNFCEFCILSCEIGFSKDSGRKVSEFKLKDLTTNAATSGNVHNVPPQPPFRLSIYIRTPHHVKNGLLSVKDSSQLVYGKFKKGESYLQA